MGHTVFRFDDCHEVLTSSARMAEPSDYVRKVKKALEKELPWSAVPEEHREIYKQAPDKEWTTWLKYEAVKVLDPECSRYVEQNTDPSRILAARVCYRDKNAVTPWLEVKPKARIVCRGDSDPDLLELRRDAPTLTRLGLMLLLQLAASWLARLHRLCRHHWSIFARRLISSKAEGTFVHPTAAGRTTRSSSWTAVAGGERHFRTSQ